MRLVVGVGHRGCVLSVGVGVYLSKYSMGRAGNLRGGGEKEGDIGGVGMGRKR